MYLTNHNNKLKGIAVTRRAPDPAIMAQLRAHKMRVFGSHFHPIWSHFWTLLSHFSTRQSCSDLRNQTGDLFHKFESRVTSFRYASGEFPSNVLLVKDANVAKGEKRSDAWVENSQWPSWRTKLWQKCKMSSWGCAGFGIWGRLICNTFIICFSLQLIRNVEWHSTI